ncbi:hypothetical protein YPPY25_1657, partial [Yersinia pestis PY-25]|jgi:hypothetical protein
MQLSR